MIIKINIKKKKKHLCKNCQWNIPGFELRTYCKEQMKKHKTWNDSKAEDCVEYKKMNYRFWERS